MFVPDWLKRTVALLWYRTYKGGVVSVLLGVSLHHRALTFSPFPLPSWVLDLRCLFLSAGGVRSVLRHSTSPLSLLLPYSSCRFSSFGPGVSCGSVLRHSTTLTRPCLSTLTLVTGSVLRHSTCFIPFSSVLLPAFSPSVLRHSGASGSMSFAWSLYDRIIDLSDAFANHFNNLLALDFQEETVQVGQDANQGQWRQVERGRRTNRADPQADQARRESLAQKLTLDTDAPNMDVHTALFKDLLAFQFASPGTYGLDELWDGTQLKWQCADLHAGVSRHTPLLYELESPDPQASNYWALENRMVGEVNYVQLFHWIQNQSTLWQEGISTVFVYVDNRPLSDPNQCPNFWGLFCPWLLARCSYLGPFQEITTAIHVPIDASSGLDKVHFTWAGTFVLEALVYLFPDKHIILIDTDCVPTSLFEVEELVRMTQTHLDQAAGVEPNTIRGNRKPACKSAVFLCSEAKAEINAGMIIITNCRLQRPHAATEPATSMAKGLLGSRQAYIRSSHPSANVDQLASSGKIVWPRHGSADLLGQTYQTRSPPFVMWAFPAFEQGALAPLVFLPATFPIRVLPGDKLFQSRVVRADCTLAPVTHAFGGSKLRVGDMLKKAGGPPLPLVAAMRGVENKDAVLVVVLWQFNIALCWAGLK